MGRIEMEKKIRKRFLLFLIGCIGARVALVWFSKKMAGTVYIRPVAYMAIVIGIGFWYIYLTGARKTGLEVGGDLIWWNGLRPFHGLMYLLFGVLSLYGYKNAWILLLVDVVVGFVSFMLYHYSENNFELLF